MSTAIVASVRAIAQAHTTFSRAAFGTVLFADSGIEGPGGDRQSSEIKQCGQRRSRERHFLPPFCAALFGAQSLSMQRHRGVKGNFAFDHVVNTTKLL